MINSSALQNWPFYFKIILFFFQWPDEFWKFGFILVFPVSERFLVVSEPVFECVGRHSDIAEVTTTDNQTTKQCIGMTSNASKNWFRNHQKSFRAKKHQNETEFSKFIWSLKEKKNNFEVKWSILKRAAVYHNGARRCNLCLEEKTPNFESWQEDFIKQKIRIIFEVPPPNPMLYKIHQPEKDINRKDRTRHPLIFIGIKEELRVLYFSYLTIALCMKLRVVTNLF